MVKIHDIWRILLAAIGARLLFELVDVALDLRSRTARHAQYALEVERFVLAILAALVFAVVCAASFWVLARHGLELLF
jgi:hypothetical protein